MRVSEEGGGSQGGWEGSGLQKAHDMFLLLGCGLPCLAGETMNPDSTKEWGQENGFSFFCPYSSVELAHLAFLTPATLNLPRVCRRGAEDAEDAEDAEMKPEAPERRRAGLGNRG